VTNPITKKLLELLEERVELIKDLRKEGGFYSLGNPFKTAEQNAEATGRIDELAYWTDTDQLAAEMQVEGYLEELDVDDEQHQ